MKSVYEHEMSAETVENMTKPAQAQFRLSEIDFLDEITDEKGNLGSSEVILAAELKAEQKALESEPEVADLVQAAYLGYFCIARDRSPIDLLTITQQRKLTARDMNYDYSNNFSDYVIGDLETWLKTYAELKFSSLNLLERDQIEKTMAAIKQHAEIWFPPRPKEEVPFGDFVEGLQNADTQATPLDTYRYGFMLPNYLYTTITIPFAGQEASVGMPISIPMSIIDLNKERLDNKMTAYLFETNGNPSKEFSYKLRFALQTAGAKFLLEQMTLSKKDESSRNTARATLDQLKAMYQNPNYTAHIAFLKPEINPRTGFFKYTRLRHQEIAPEIDVIFERFNLLLKNAILYKERLSQHRKRMDLIRSGKTPKPQKKLRTAPKYQPSLF